MRTKLLCAALTALVAMTGPGTRAGLADTTASPPASIIDAAAVLARQDGGVLEVGPAGSPAGRKALDELVAARARDGERIWVLIAAPGDDLGRTLEVVAGRLAPGERDMVLVASAGGARARVPALSGSPQRIDAAFDASRRELAADLEGGLAAFARRLEDARDEQRREVRAVLAAIGVGAVVLVLVLVGRWGRFRVLEARWQRDAGAAHARAVAACQERLHRLSELPDRALYDRHYAELKELSARPPAESAAGLADLQQRLDAALSDTKRLQP